MARAEIQNTRLTIDLPAGMHRLIKAKASLQNMSIKDFVIRAIENDVDDTPVSKNIPNKKTAAALRYSMKNPQKLKSFKNTDEAMKWLLADKTITPKKPKRNNERNSTRKPL
jgi:hypothetical protein